jgi:hypothetical protein
MSQDGEDLEWAMLSLEALFEFHSFRIPPKEKRGRFGEGQFEVGVSDFLARRTVSLPGRLPDAFDEPGVRSEFLDPGKAANVVDLIKDRESENGADAMDGSKEMEGLGIVISRILKDVAFEIPDHKVEGINEIEIGGDAHANIGICELVQDALAMDFVGDLFPEFGEIVLAVGV